MQYNHGKKNALEHKYFLSCVRREKYIALFIFIFDVCFVMQ